MSREIEQIVDLARSAVAAGVGSLLATVVRVRGSTYRRPGARMLVTDDGRSAGVVSGGCLERHVVEHGRRLVAAGGPVIVSFDTTSDDEIVWEFGLGCRGVVHLLLERIAPGAPAPLLDALSDGFRGVGRVVVATVVSAPPSCGSPVARRVILRDGAAIDVGDPPIDARLSERVVDFAAGLSHTTHACFECADGVIEVFFELVESPPSLVVFGAGRDAEPLVALGAAIGWRVTLVDSRAAYAKPDRFPDAQEIVVCGADEIAERMAIDGRTFAVVMTHRYHEDLAILRALLPSSAAYIGLLGPRSRADELLAELRLAGPSPTPAQLARLHAPVGLDIAADNPDQIALAILAELTAVRGRRAGGFLRDRSGPIHEPQSDNILRAGHPSALPSGRPSAASP